MKLNFSQRVSLYVMALTTLLFVVTLGIVYKTARYYLYNKTMQEVSGQLDITDERINAVQTNIETISRNLQPRLLECLNNPDKLLEVAEETVVGNSLLASVGIGFKQNYFAGSEAFHVVARRYYKDNSVQSYIFKNAEQGNYFCMDWFQIPFLLEKSYWSEAYESYDNYPVVSYLSPILDERGEPLAVLSVDIRLYEFTKLVNQDKGSENLNYLIDRRGTFLVAPEHDLIMRETMFTLSDATGDKALWDIGLRMIHGGTGVGKFNENASSAYMLFKPTGQMGWSTAIVVPESIITKSIQSMSRRTIIATICGLILTYFLCFMLIRRLTKPLNALTISAGKISAGNFNSPLPKLKRNDEIKNLCNAFTQMQESLAESISGLISARDHARQVNRMMAAFIRNIGKDIRTPINAIMGFSNVMAESVPEEQRSEQEQYADIIVSNCMILDRLLKRLVSLSELEDESNRMNFVQFGCRDICTSVIADFLLSNKQVNAHMEGNLEENTDIETDPMQLKNLLSDLLENVTAMSQSDSVVLSYSITEHPGEVTFAVTSKGNTVSDKDAENFFRRFEHQDLTDSNDNSLGLYICYLIAKKLHCKLYVDTSYKEGNRFVLVHPLKQQ